MTRVAKRLHLLEYFDRKNTYRQCQSQRLLWEKYLYNFFETQRLAGLCPKIYYSGQIEKLGLPFIISEFIAGGVPNRGELKESHLANLCQQLQKLCNTNFSHDFDRQSGNLQKQSCKYDLSNDGWAKEGEGEANALDQLLNLEAKGIYVYLNKEGNSNLWLTLLEICNPSRLVLAHGDLKPGNIILDLENRVRLIDWKGTKCDLPKIEMARLAFCFYFLDQRIEELLSLQPANFQKNIF